MTEIQTPLTILKKYWGYDSFREIQEDVINSVMSGKDTLAFARTSMGKTVTFQVPALLLDGITLVISPLLALQKDQVDNCIEKGIPVAMINSETGVRARKKLKQQLENKEIKILYVAPETILGDNFSDILPLLDVSLIAVDEAHCFKKTTKVETNIGRLTFEDLYNLQLEYKTLPMAKCVNNSNEIEYKQIKTVFQNPFKQLQRTVFHNQGKIDSTPCHLFFTTEGEKKASDLQVGDKVYSYDNNKSKQLSPMQLQFVLGSILGDGGIQCLDENLHTHRIKFTHCLAQKDYISWKNSFIGYQQDLTYISENGYNKKPAYSCTSFSFNLPENIYPVKRGTLRPKFSQWFIDNLNAQALAIWYADDGTFYRNKKDTNSGLISIACNSFSTELCEQIIEMLRSKYNINSYIKNNNGYNSICFKAEDTILFLNLVSNFIHPSMIYKNYDNAFYSEWLDNSSEMLQTSTVISTKLLRVMNKDYLYDMEVEDNHNYFVVTESTNGSLSRKYQSTSILVHNCCSQWSDFRPKYKEVYRLREEFFPNARLLAVTATADDAVKKDIIKYIGFNSDYNLYQTSFDRPSINYHVIHITKPPTEYILKLIRMYPKGTAGIIYSGSRAKSEEMASFLKLMGYNAICYHAGMKKKEKTEAQTKYLSGEVDIVCATIAFGMGIDKSNIRYVIHTDPPHNFESAAQEFGRASRDGLPSSAYILYSPVSFNSAQWLIRQTTPNPDRLSVKLKKLKDFHSFCRSSSCLRVQLLAQFGEKYPSKKCGKCGNCGSELLNLGDV